MGRRKEATSNESGENSIAQAEVANFFTHLREFTEHCEDLLKGQSVFRHESTDLHQVIKLFPLEPYTQYANLRTLWDRYYAVRRSCAQLPASVLDGASKLLGRPWDSVLARSLTALMSPLEETSHAASCEDERFQRIDIDELPGSLLLALKDYVDSQKILWESFKVSEPWSIKNTFAWIVVIRPCLLVEVTLIRFACADLSSWREHLEEIEERRLDLVTVSGNEFERERNRDLIAKPEPPNSSDSVTHSPDFRCVLWFGTEYSFTTRQSHVVRMLIESWQADTPDVGDETLLNAVDPEAPRLGYQRFFAITLLGTP